METARTRHGTLALRGAMVPARPFPPAAVHDEDTEADGYLDTGFTCCPAPSSLVVTAPPCGTLSVGGYRFHQQAVEAALATVEPAATLLGVPHGILGQRLAASAPDRQAVAAELRARGANSLLAAAFGAA